MITLAYQINLRERVELLGGSPDLRVIFLVFLSLCYRRVMALVFGFLGGLFLDALSPQTMGVGALLGSVSGYLLGSVKTKLLIESPWVRATTAVVVFWLWELVLLLLFPSFGSGSPRSYLFRVLLPSAVYTFIVGFVFFWIFRRTEELTP